MLVPFSLPPDCNIRPARSGDKLLIRELLKQFRQEVLPPISQREWSLRIISLVLVLGLGVYLTASVGLQQLFSVLLGPAIVLGLGILCILMLTWNEEWENFWVIEHHQAIVACAKLRRHSRYSLLHDLYVLPEWRSQGLGSCLVTYLGEQATRPLYLTCLPSLVQFYVRLGFTPVLPKNLPPLLQYDLGIPGRLEVIPLMLN